MFYNFARNVYRLLKPTSIHGEDNIVEVKSKRNHFLIRVFGNHNLIKIGDNCRLKNTSITIVGDNNQIIVESGAKFDGPCKVILEGNACLSVGRNSGIRGVTFVLKDGNISVGRNCMFSYDVILRNNDSHKVVDLAGKVINLAQDIRIGDHVWFCERSTILKGVTIESNSIIAFGAVVTKDCPANSIMAGNPAQVVKKDINWVNK